MTETRQLPPDTDAALARHPAVNELADIFHAAFDLAARIREFQHDHRRSCRCACCRYVRANAIGGPDVFAFLTTIEAVIWASEAAQEERPVGAADVRFGEGVRRG